MSAAKVTIALGIPHTPWVPERAESMARLRAELGNRPQFYREFDDKASNRVWARQMWNWAVETGADFFLTLQDDVMAAPCFWPALRAMLAQLPRGSSLGLTQVHPVGAEVARRGHRWYRTQAWNVGWAYGMWREDLFEFARYELAAHPAVNEDELVNQWHGDAGKFVWHPVPTIVDHDTSIPSSYANDHHSHRRPAVTWRGYAEADLTAPDFWKVSGEVPTLYPTVPAAACWNCATRRAVIRTPRVELCAVCVGEFAHGVLSRVQ